MKIGHLIINTNEINYFSIDRRSSLDIVIMIYFKNGQNVWVRASEDEINKLTNKIVFGV
jgi:hypothetical protein